MKNHAYPLAVDNFEVLAHAACLRDPMLAHDPSWAPLCVTKTLRQAKTCLLPRIDYLSSGRLTNAFAAEVQKFCHKRMALNAREHFRNARRHVPMPDGFAEIAAAPELMRETCGLNAESLLRFLIEERGVGRPLATAFTLVRVLRVPNPVAQTTLERHLGATWPSPAAFRKAISRVGKDHEAALADWAREVGLVGPRSSEGSNLPRRSIFVRPHISAIVCYLHSLPN